MKKLLIAFALLLSSLAFAQNPYVIINGKLQGPNGLPAANQILSFTPTQSFFVAGLGSNGCNGYTLEINGVNLTCADTVNFNNTTPPAPANGLNIVWQKSTSGTTDSVSAAVVGNGNASDCLSGIGTYVACSGGGSGGGNPTLDNCTPDETGNSFYSVTSLTSFYYGSWEFLPSTTAAVYCTVFIPTGQSGATIRLDVASADSTSGHTVNFQTCDGMSNTTANVPSLTCASVQSFSTSTTAYGWGSLVFNVQSSLSSNNILVVKIIASPTSGTAPTSNILVYPHFIL
jgi:hypothetical protein